MTEPYAISMDMLHAFVDGQLDDDDRIRVEQWLVHHPEDAALVAEWQVQNETLREMFPAMESIPHVRLGTQSQRQRIPLHNFKPIGVATFAMVLMLFGVVSGWYARGVFSEINTETTHVVLSEAMSAHVIYASDLRRPVEITADKESLLVKWLSKRLGYRLEAPNLSALGLKLVGGRLVPSRDGPAALFMYEDDTGNRVTLYVVHGSGDQMAAFRYKSDGNLKTFYWSDEKLVYALVGEVARTKLLSLATSVYEQLS